MKAEYEMKFEQKMGKLEDLNPALKQMLFDAFVIALKKEELEKIKEEREKRIAKKYATCAGQPDTPDRKMKRYRQDRAVHNGLVKSIVCSCYNADSAAVPCPYDMGRPDRIGMPPRKKVAHLVVSGNRLLNKLESPVLKLLRQYENEELYNDD
tara:strand:- start:164 stop:622 length:459 start_codon:yes stop_codon:yes gene_type:complete